MWQMSDAVAYTGQQVCRSPPLVLSTDPRLLLSFSCPEETPLPKAHVQQRALHVLEGGQ